MKLTKKHLLLSYLLLPFLPACGIHDSQKQTQLNSMQDVADVKNLGGNKYLVTCKDSTQETLSEADLLNNNICNSAKHPLPVGNDVFEDGICPGSTVSPKEVLGKMGLPNTLQRSIGTYNVYMRAKICYDELKGACTDWISSGKFANFADNDGYLFKLFVSDNIQIPNLSEGKGMIYYVNNSIVLNLFPTPLSYLIAMTLKDNGKLGGYLEGGLLSSFKKYNAKYYSVQKFTNQCYHFVHRDAISIKDNAGNPASLYQEVAVVGKNYQL